MSSNNGHYPLQRLGDLITLEYGETLPDEGRQGGSVPVYGSNGVVGYHNESHVSGPGIVVGRKGSIGRTAWVDGDFWPIDTTYYVKQKTGHSLRWLYNLLATRSMERLNTATGVPGLNRDDAYALKIPVPTEDESSRIAEILTSVDEAIERTRGVIDQTRQLKTALLQDLLTHGLPGKHSEFVEHKNLGTIPKDWQVMPLRDAVAYWQYGLSESLAEAGAYPCLRMNNYADGRITAEDVKYADVNAKVFKHYKLECGDILFNRTNSRELVGKVGIFDLPGDYVFASYLVRMRADLEVVTPEFLNLLLNTADHQNRIKRLATPGVSQSNINAENLKRLLVALPNIEEQRAILALLTAVRRSIETKSARLDQLASTKTALSQALLTGRVRVASKGVGDGL